VEFLIWFNTGLPLHFNIH